jgi:hypothetical protein
MSSKRFSFLLHIINLTIVSAAFCGSGSAADKVLWDEWYSVTIGAKTHYEYYNERVELKGDRYFYKSDTWKKEEDYINRETLGEFAQNEPEVTPLFFNFHSVYRTTETQIDGTVINKLMTVKTKKGDKESPVLKKGISSKTILSSFFPVWLGKHATELQTKKELTFYTILEDGTDPDFSTITGKVKLLEPDDYAVSTKTVKVQVELSDSRALWWIDASGAAVKIEMPDLKTVVEKVSKAKALHFLD